MLRAPVGGQRALRFVIVFMSVGEQGLPGGYPFLLHQAWWFPDSACRVARAAGCSVPHQGLGSLHPEQ